MQFVPASVSNILFIKAIVGYKHNQDPAMELGTPAHHIIGVVTARVDRIGQFQFIIVGNCL